MDFAAEGKLIWLPAPGFEIEPLKPSALICTIGTEPKILAPLFIAVFAVHQYEELGAFRHDKPAIFQQRVCMNVKSRFRPDSPNRPTT